MGSAAPQCLGISRTGVIVSILCILVLCAIVFVALMPNVQGRGPGGARRVMDAARIKQIHQSWLIMARQYDGVYPTPSMIVGGEPDQTLDTTANLFSMSVMANFLSPERYVGPTEPSRKVVVKDDYNWDLYSPVDGVYWDDTFAADLAVESNVSYAHMPLFGANMELYWRETMGADFPILGNRGPLGGADDPDSITYKIHDSSKRWGGNVCRVDGSVRWHDMLTPTGEDNIFAWDRGGPVAEDAMITFTKAMAEDGPVIQHD